MKRTAGSSAVLIAPSDSPAQGILELVETGENQDPESRPSSERIGGRDVDSIHASDLESQPVVKVYPTKRLTRPSGGWTRVTCASCPS